jgi:hypothetical protein
MEFALQYTLRSYLCVCQLFKFLPLYGFLPSFYMTRTQAKMRTEVRWPSLTLAEVRLTIETTNQLITKIYKLIKVKPTRIMFACLPMEFRDVSTTMVSPRKCSLNGLAEDDYKSSDLDCHQESSCPWYTSTTVLVSSMA